MKKAHVPSVVAGAAFLMATSAAGPGILTQTSVFTTRLGGSFGFVILVSVLLEIFALMNIWRVLTVSGKRAQQLANATIPGSGYVLSALVAFGGLVFNIGNIAGCGLGLNALTGLPVRLGAALSALAAIAIFVFNEAGRRMDLFVKLLGVVMLGLVFYVLWAAHPPFLEAAQRTVMPERIEPLLIITMIGGTVGGYITFAGVHRLIDAGVTGTTCLPQVDRGALTGIMFTAGIRIFLFLATLGVLAMGMTIDEENPAASVFQNAAGGFGYRIFGIVMWAAAITSVVGAAYTSASFIKTVHHRVTQRESTLIIGFILVSALIFLLVGQPVEVLVWAGTVNGFILPVGLAIVLLGSRRKNIVGDYKHPLWMQMGGWAVVVVMLGFSLSTLIHLVY
ncbi:MAG: divalent metal cation transporter [Acidobacteria bacterium]|nr:divalent metal cation transporter [Acidobacteriota bacterium]